MQNKYAPIWDVNVEKYNRKSESVLGLCIAESR